MESRGMRCALLLIVCSTLRSAQSQVCTQTEADIAFVVDHSGSIEDSGTGNWNFVTTFVSLVIDQLEVGLDKTRVGAVGFGNEASTWFNFARYDNKNAMRAFIESKPFDSGNTNTTGGLRETRQNLYQPSGGDRGGVRDIIILITDGVPTREEDLLMDEVDLIKSLGIRIIGIGVTNNVNETLLRSIVTSPDSDHYFPVQDFSNLEEIIDRLVEEACRTILPTPTPAPTQPDICTQTQADIALVVDHSGSIEDSGTGNWNFVTTFISLVVEELDIGLDRTRVGAVGFGNEASVWFNLATYGDKNAMRAFIESKPFDSGNTNTTGGLRETRQTLFQPSGGDRDGVRDIIILITDGVPTREEDLLMDEVDLIKSLGIRIIGIGVTNNVNETLLRSIVTSPDSDHYFPVQDFSNLEEIIDRLVEEACRTIQPTPSPTPPPGLCDNQGDIIFIIDASGSMQLESFAFIQGFLSNLVQDLEIDNDQIRVGILMFSDSPNVVADLNQYGSRQEIQDVINAMQYLEGTTNTAGALSYVRTQMYVPGRGDRNGVPNVVVVLTDGGSNDKRSTLDEAYQVKSAGIHIITIGVGNWLDEYELIGMSSHPYENNKFNVDRFEDLDNIRDQIRNRICNNINECGSNPCQNGGICVDAIETYWCRCPSGFAGINCERTCRTPSDITFALDSSGSIGRANFQLEIDFLREVVLGLNLNGDSQVALVTYGTDSQLLFDLNDHTDRLAVLNALMAYYTGGTTDTAGALGQLRNTVYTPARGDRAGVPNLGVVLTDGRSNDETQTWQEAKQARSDGISLLALGIGDNLRERELEAISSPPFGKNVFKVGSFSELGQAREQLLAAICNDEDDCNPNPCLNSGQCVDLSNGYECQCTSGFTGVNCERGCSGKIDLMFVIDASGSIRNDRFPKVIDFINSIVAELEIGPEKVMVGAIKFSDTAVKQFDLNVHPDKQDVMVAIKNVEFMGGKTNSAGAINMMKDNMYTSGNGDRSDAPNVVVFFTDGNSNINPDDTLPAAIAARVQGNHIIVIGLGTDVNMLELAGIASNPTPSNIFPVQSWRDLPGIKDAIVDAMCDDVDECSSGPCQNGGNCLNQLKRFWCMCQFDWTGETCSRRCTSQMDVALVLDLSGSVDQVYDIILSFARQVIHGLPILGDRARVSVISYQDNAQIRFYLDAYQSKEEILNAIVFLKAGGSTNTQEAIRETYNNVFTASRGDRNGVPNIMVVVSDGKSTVNSANTIAEANNARNRGIAMYSVAVGSSPDMGEINGIANDPDNDYVVRLQSAGEVDNAANDLLDRLCML